MKFQAFLYIWGAYPEWDGLALPKRKRVIFPFGARNWAPIHTCSLGAIANSGPGVDDEPIWVNPKGIGS